MTENKKIILYISFSFLFSIAMRMIWILQFSGIEEVTFNNVFMINTNDGYFYAKGARDILSGIAINTNDLASSQSALSNLTAFIAKTIPISFEKILFYMSTFFASLLVIPLILIGKKIDNLEVGLIAALFSSIAWSYYNRTMVGYYDTDMLNIVFPTLLLWSLIWAVETKKDIFLLFTAFDILAYRWWYPQSYALEFSFFTLILLYLFYLIVKTKKPYVKLYENIEIAYVLQLLTIMLLSMVQIEMTLRVMLVFGYFMLFRQIRWHKHLLIMLLMSFIIFLATGGFDPIWGQLKGYVFKQSILVGEEGLQLHFFTVMQTVREAGQISFETFANRISGHTITFICSLIGYIWLSLKQKSMLLALPMLGLGFLALSGGLRFTIYAIPVLALGLGYVIVQVSSLLTNNLSNRVIQKIFKYTLLFIFTSMALYPNIIHIINYKIPTVFTKNEVEVLDKLKSKLNREDYVVSWWDYGYAIRYYSDVKSLSDGGKHGGDINFPISFMLLSNQEKSAKMARLDVEYTEKRFRENDLKSDSSVSNIEQMTLDYGFNNTNDFLDSLSKSIDLPAQTRDIYFYLSHRKMDILTTISMFSNRDLMTGKKKEQLFFYESNNIKQNKNNIDLGNGIILFKDTGKITIGKEKIKINNFILTYYDPNGKLQKREKTIDTTSPISVIYMKNYNKFLVVDQKMYNSTYIQLFVLENYDKNLFEPITLSPLSKVYKLKI